MLSGALGRSVAGLLLSVGVWAGRRDVKVLPAGGAPPVRVGRLQPVSGRVDVDMAGKWRRAEDVTPLFTGQNVRTDAAGAAQIDLAWATLVLGPSSDFQLLPSRILIAALEHGRVEQRASAIDIIRFRTPEVSISGHGYVVVRRDGTTTSVSALAGAFRIDSEHGSADLDEGQGLVAGSESLSEPDRLPPPAADLRPGRDPLYVIQGEPVTLRWTESSARSHVQVASDTGGFVVADSDVDGATFSVAPPLGLYRWRVSSISANGLESRPSADGFLCVVER